MKAPDREQQLSHIPLFARLPRGELQHLAVAQSVRGCPEHTILLRVDINTKNQFGLCCDEVVGEKRPWSRLGGPECLFGRMPERTCTLPGIVSDGASQKPRCRTLRRRCAAPWPAPACSSAGGMRRPSVCPLQHTKMLDTRLARTYNLVSSFAFFASLGGCFGKQGTRSH